MVVRDRDVLVELGRQASCSVCVSVPTVDEDAWRALEPGTAHPLQRLRAVRELVDAGVHAGVLMAPVVPGFTTQPSRLERTIKAIADHGARFVGSQVLHLQEGTRTHFMEFLSREFPDLRPRYEALYAGAYAPRSYTTRVQGLVAMLKARYGPFTARTVREEPASRVMHPSQGTFSWSGS
jgi:DNA repair photolyase